MHLELSDAEASALTKEIRQGGGRTADHMTAM
jgi:hypothetical protein